MSFGGLLKALRENAKLSRAATVTLLRKQGIRTSVASLERLEYGQTRALELVIALIRLYHSRVPIRPGVIETAFMSGVENQSFNDRQRRFIAAKLGECSSKQLADIAAIIQNIKS